MSNLAEKPTVLFYENTAEPRASLKQELEKHGVQVRTAKTSRDVLDIIANTQVDLILSESDITKTLEKDFFQRLKNMNKKPSLLIISEDEDISWELVNKLGVETVFSKPTNSQIISDAIHKCLRHKNPAWMRVHERIPLQANIEFTFEDFDANRRSLTHNISSGGLFIVLSKDLPPLGTKLNFVLKFDNDSHKTIHGYGVVRWIRKYKESQKMPAGFGIEFEQIDPESQKIVKSTLETFNSVAFLNDT